MAHAPPINSTTQDTTNTDPNPPTSHKNTSTETLLPHLPEGSSTDKPQLHEEQNEKRRGQTTPQKILTITGGGVFFSALASVAGLGTPFEIAGALFGVAVGSYVSSKATT